MRFVLNVGAEQNEGVSDDTLLILTQLSRITDPRSSSHTALLLTLIRTFEFKTRCFRENPVVMENLSIYFRCPHPDVLSNVDVSFSHSIYFKRKLLHFQVLLQLIDILDEVSNGPAVPLQHLLDVVQPRVPHAGPGLAPSLPRPDLSPLISVIGHWSVVVTLLEDFCFWPQLTAPSPAAA